MSIFKKKKVSIYSMDLQLGMLELRLENLKNAVRIAELTGSIDGMRQAKNEMIKIQKEVKSLKKAAGLK